MGSLRTDWNPHRRLPAPQNLASEGIPRRETWNLVRYADWLVSGRPCQAEGWSWYVLAQGWRASEGTRLATRSLSLDAQLKFSCAVLFHHFLNELADGVV